MNGDIPPSCICWLRKDKLAATCSAVIQAVSLCGSCPLVRTAMATTTSLRSSASSLTCTLFGCRSRRRYDAQNIEEWQRQDPGNAIRALRGTTTFIMRLWTTGLPTKRAVSIQKRWSHAPTRNGMPPPLKGIRILDVTRVSLSAGSAGRRLNARRRVSRYWLGRPARCSWLTWERM
jgi:hypothetical protein